MTFSQLRYFYEIGKCGSFTEGARRLHVTQPSLSKSIAALEEEVGHQLFRRVKGGITLTEFGKSYFKQTAVVLKELDKLKNMCNSDGSILGGIPPTIGYCFIFDITRHFQRAGLPSVRWKECGTSKLEQMLNAGSIDVAVLPKSLVNIENFDYIHFASVEEVLYVSNQNPLAKEKQITRDKIEKQTFVLFSQEYNQNVPFEQLFNHAGFEPSNVIYTSQLSTSLDMIEKDMAVAIMIDEILYHESKKYQISTVSLSPPYCLELILAWKKGNQNKGIRKLANELSKVFK